MSRRRLAILGSTGSIGTQALQVLDRLNAQHTVVGGVGRFEVVALAAHNNRELLAQQVKRYRPRYAALASEDPKILERFASLSEIDTVIHAVSGAAGLAASFAAARTGKRLCLANKESLVCAGPLLTKLVERNGGELLPIDSEHSAIFQALASGQKGEVRRLILTASGGPFRDAKKWPNERLAVATAEQAMAHPTWRMGGKITIDSATLFNKALELIEAVRLFRVPHERVEVVVHPQSVVHSMVEFVDGSTIAQLSPPDMRLPIGYALTYPERFDGGARRLDFSAACSLDFEPPDETRFPALRLARRALDAGGTMPLVLNAANEVAVEHFASGRLSFGGIATTVEKTMQRTTPSDPTNLEDLLAADADARRVAGEMIAGLE